MKRCDDDFLLKVFDGPGFVASVDDYCESYISMKMKFLITLRPTCFLPENVRKKYSFLRATNEIKFSPYCHVLNTLLHSILS